MSNWVTGTEASTITGKTVTDPQVSVAQPIIEIFTNVTTEASASLKPRDLRLLRYATAYQAYWMTTQVDVLSRLDVDNVTQDGVTYAKGDEPDVYVLAPLAKRCVLRLSWMKSRTILPLTPEQAAYLRGVLVPGVNLTGAEEFLDDQQQWKPLHGGGRYG